MRLSTRRTPLLTADFGVWSGAWNRAIGVLDATGLALACILGVGVLLRIWAALRLPVFVDEPHSVLGVRAVAEHGVPTLPSGILYLHGATLSYLAAPFAWAGFGDLASLSVLRLLSVAAGSIAVYLTYRVAREIGGSTTQALLAAGLIALDPISVVWSGHFRMYALLQALVMLVVWMFVRAVGPAARLDARCRRGVLVCLVAAFWLAVFTHIAAAALWPAMALVAVAFLGHGLYRGHRDVSVALGLCLLAPMAFVAASSLLGGGAGTARSGESDAHPVFSFVGSPGTELEFAL